MPRPMLCGLERVSLALLLLGTGPCAVRGQTPLATYVSARDERPRIFTPIPPPGAADSLWQAMRACSGAAVQPGGDLADVKWFVGDLVAYDRFHSILAAFRPPDTIWVNSGHRDSLWLIAHELLHHLLRGPPGKDKHPFTPFWFPCQAMPAQHQAGGIGAAREGAQ